MFRLLLFSCSWVGTKDNVTCSVNAVVYYRVVNSENAVVNVENYREATAQLAQTTLRSVAGQAELDELLAERDKLNQKIQQILDEATDAWGIKVTAVEIKDVVIPEGLQRAISRQASAERERRAVIIQADGERQAAQKLAQSASILSSQPGGFFVRLMRILPEISYQQGNIIAFPLPMELRHLFDAFNGTGEKEGETPPPEGDEEGGSEEDLAFGGEGIEAEGEEGLPPHDTGDDDTEDENF